MKSIGQKIKQVTGLIDTRDVSDWENRFLRDMKIKTNDGERTTHLSVKQVEWIEDIYDKHFAPNVLPFRLVK